MVCDELSHIFQMLVIIFVCFIKKIIEFESRSFLFCYPSLFRSLQILLERYFAMSGEDIEIVLPKQMDLQEKLRRGAPLDIDFS